MPRDPSSAAFPVAAALIVEGSDVLVPMVEALWLQYGAFLNLIIQQSAAAEIDEHVFHHALITAIEQGDRAAAQAALAQDIERSFHLIAPADPKETSS